jgi:excisionase family DNA binding protein
MATMDTPLVNDLAGKLLLTEKEAARLLSVSTRTLWSLRAAGKIPYVRIAATGIRYSRDDLIRFIRTQTVNGA